MCNMTSLRRLHIPQNCWRHSYLWLRHQHSCSCRISAQPKVIVETFYHYSHSQVKFEIWASESSFWVGQNTQLFVSGPKFTKFDSPTREGSLWIKYSSNFWYLDPFRRHSGSRKVLRNRAELCMFLPHEFFFGVVPPIFWDLDYKTQPNSDYATNFHGDRQRELGDLALKKDKKRKHQQ